MSTPLELEPGGVGPSRGGARGSEAHRGPLARADRLDAPQARQGRPDRRVFIIFLVVGSIIAPLIVNVLGHPPDEFHQEFIDPDLQVPTAPFGGVSRDFLFGLEPVNGRDLFSRVLFGSQISLLIAFLATIISVVIGTITGCRRRLLRRRGRRLHQPADGHLPGLPAPLFALALVGVDPRAGLRAERRLAADRRHRLHHRLLQLALHRPHRPRSDPVAARARVHRRLPQPRRPGDTTSCARTCCPTSSRRSSSTRPSSSRPTSSSRPRCPTSASAFRPPRATWGGMLVGRGEVVPGRPLVHAAARPGHLRDGPRLQPLRGRLA